MSSLSIKNVKNINNLWATCTYPINRRNWPRIGLMFPVIIKGRGDMFFMRNVKTVNVSREGAAVVLNEELEVGMMVGFSAFKGKFIAAAIVTNVQPCEDSGWQTGLKFIEQKGKWVVG